jgi:hypothetical protein
MLTGMDMDEGRYFRQLASRCYELGRACFDLDISLQLNEIGDELLLNASKSDGHDSVNSRLILVEGRGSRQAH